MPQERPAAGGESCEAGFFSDNRKQKRKEEKIMAAKTKKNQKEQKKKKQIMIAGAVVLCFCIVAVLITVFMIPKESEGDNAPETDHADVEAEDAGKQVSGSCYADIEIQDYGTVTIQLDQETAPITTENFINLAESGFYDGLTFHRIMEGFMMQGGDPEGTGMGGSDQTIEGEFSANGYDNDLSHTRGAVSMARSNDYNSASSQFFIVHQDSKFLDGQYAVFGYVTEGMEIVDQICESAEPTDDNGTIPADQQPVITKITMRTE